MSDKLLKYIGGGSFIPGWPARDIVKSDVEIHGLDLDKLVESGLYERAELPAQEDQPAPAVRKPPARPAPRPLATGEEDDD